MSDFKQLRNDLVGTLHRNRFRKKDVELALHFHKNADDFMYVLKAGDAVLDLSIEQLEHLKAVLKEQSESR